MDYLLLSKLKRNRRKGSTPRCHRLTHGTPEQVARRLNALTEPWGTVSPDDQWMPEGFCRIEEAQLDKASKLLSKPDRDKLRDWWLAVSRRNTRTPNWDIASTCTVDNTKGILLVEAKAHNEELNNEIGGKRLECDATANSRSNHARIGKAIDGASIALADQTGYMWDLSRDHRYQMSNRFAWAWKLTELGYPVILVYLGFLGAVEMRKGREQNPLNSHADWEDLAKAHSQPLFPHEVWDRQWDINGQPFVPRICSINIGYDAPMEEDVPLTCT